MTPDQIQSSAMAQLMEAKLRGLDPAYWSVSGEIHALMLDGVRGLSLHGYSISGRGRVTEFLGLPVSLTNDRPNQIRLNVVPKGVAT